MRAEHQLESYFARCYPAAFRGLEAVWEASDWSATWRVVLSDREPLYVKGTPRNAAEAQVTAALHGLYPAHVSTVLESDLLPDAPWRWFVMEDAGDCDYQRLDVATALTAAFHLGRLQQLAEGNASLATMLPQCRAEGLQNVILSICDWALPEVAPETGEHLLTYRATTAAAADFFHLIAQQLAPLPATVMHGDFWSGNIARHADGIVLIDWGDALWGVGSASVAHLLRASDGALIDDAERIWEAYARGRQRDVSPGLIAASRVAADVAFLLVDVEIARRIGRGAEMLPGLLPALQAITDAIV